MPLRKHMLMPIGIHMDLEHVHMAQFEQTDDGVRLVAKASQWYAPIPEVLDARIADAPSPTVDREVESRYGEARQFIKRALGEHGFRGKEAVVSLPADLLAIRHLRVASAQPDELAAALPWELQGKLPFDPRAAVVRHIVSGSIAENNETKQDVIVMAAPRSAVEKHVGAMEKIGLKITGVGAEPCSMCYPYSYVAMHTPPGKDGHASKMLVYLAPVHTHVAIVRGQELMFVKDIEQGTEHVARALAEERDIPTAKARELRAGWREAAPEKRDAATQEAVKAYSEVRFTIDRFVDELESCMRYHTSLAGGAQIDEVAFVGPEARDRALVRVLGSNLGAECHVANPLETVTETECEPEPELAVALGLSLFAAK